MRAEDELRKLLNVARTEQKRARASDYWNGIIDALDWAVGNESKVVDVWLGVNTKRAGRSVVEVDLPETTP